MDQTIDFQRLLKLRKVTRAISGHLTHQIKSHLKVLTPIFDPRRTFGTYIQRETKLTPPTAQKQINELQKIYNSLRSDKTYARLEKFATPIDVLATSVEINTAQYNYSARIDGHQKSVSVITPLKWTVSYKCLEIDLLRKLLFGQPMTRNGDLKHYVLHHLVLNSILSIEPGVRSILNGLNYPVKIEHSTENKKLPIPLITFPIATVRPADNLIIEATEFSGTSTFEEIIDLHDISRMTHPLKQQLFDIVKKQDEELFTEISEQ